jgi:lipocalin-like protein
MRNSFKVLVLSLLVTFALGSPAHCHERLIGSWTLISWITENVETRERTSLHGRHPSGVLVFTPTQRWVSLLTADNRVAPSTDAERIAAYLTMVAYSGRYRIEGDKVITTPDVSWNSSLVGREQVRFFRFEDDRLIIESTPIPNLNFGGITRSIQTFEREK